MKNTLISLYQGKILGIRKLLLFLFFLQLHCVLMAQRQNFTISVLTKKDYTLPANKEFDINKKDYEPYIHVFLPDKEKAGGRAVLICPGGGYGMIAFGHEGTRWADFFNEKGIAVAVLKYRLPKGDYKIPISDAETALHILNDNAEKWNINKIDIGIMGFSAGGHLASTIATHTENALRPKFQILFYPVITMDKSYTHIGSHDNFLGRDASAKMEALYSSEQQITTNTPPAFIVLAQDDQVVHPDNGINYFRSLTAKKIPTTMHIYPHGNHGWGYSRSYKYNAAILQELKLWLDKL